MNRALKGIYESLQEKALQEAQARRENAHRRCPELARIAVERRDMLLAKNKDAATLSQLNAREEELLREMGLTREDLLPQYSCNLCGDTGYAGDTVKTPCPCRSHYQPQRQSDINQVETFEAFDQSLYKDKATCDSMVAIKNYLEQFADAVPNARPATLLLLGNVGLGKSFFTNAVAHRALARGIPAQKLTAYHFIRRVLQSFEEPKVLDELLTCKLLCIDDLGVEPLMNNVTLEYLFLVLNERQGASRPTMLATNLSLKKLQERYTDRLFSRLVAPSFTKVLELKGADIRRASMKIR